MTRMKALILGTLTTIMILGSSLVIAAEPPADDGQGFDRAAAVQTTVSSIGGGTGRALPK